MMSSQTPEQQILARPLGGSGARTLTRSVKRFTPYRSAVASRSRTVPQPVKSYSFTPGKPARGAPAPAPSADLDPRSDLVNKTWRLYRVSPLYRLRHEPRWLREYARALALAIEAESHRGTAVAGGPDASGSKITEFTSLASLRSSGDDSNTVRIVVKEKPGTAGGKEKAPVLIAYLCSVDVSPSVAAGLAPEFVYLPLLMVKSSVFLTSVLRDFIQKRFDCVIRDLTLCSTDMHWLFTINAGFVPEKLENKPAELMYVLGKEVEGIDKITFSIDAKHCQDIIQSVCGEESEDLSQAQKDRVMRALEQHFYFNFRLNLDRLKLQRIATAVSVVGAEGRLKMYSPDHVLQILSFLTTLCCEHFEKVTGLQAT